jgi:hypothetical protein
MTRKQLGLQHEAHVRVLGGIINDKDRRIRELEMSLHDAQMLSRKFAKEIHRLREAANEKV